MDCAGCASGASAPPRPEFRRLGLSGRADGGMSFKKCSETRPFMLLRALEKTEATGSFLASLQVWLGASDRRPFLSKIEHGKENYQVCQIERRLLLLTKKSCE
jgi:hypothetical protein